MASSPARAVSDQAPARVPVALPADLPAHLAASLVADLGAGDAAATSSLATALATVPEARHRRGRRHELTGVLAIEASACLTGATSYVAIGEWAVAQRAAVLDCLGRTGFPAVLPCEATLRRCLQTTDPGALAAAVTGWTIGQLTAQQARAAGATAALVLAAPGRRVIAIDGKTLRGARSPDGAQVKVFGVYDHDRHPL